MKQAIVLAATLSLAASLAACNNAQTDEAAAPEDTVAATGTEPTTVDPAVAGFEAVAPGNYEIVHADGTIDQLVVHPGLTWSRVAANGDATGGTIFAQGGKNCFVTEGVEGHRCFLGTPPAADGSIQVTGDDGEKAVVRPARAGAATPAA
jgi:ABC-type transport system substrate-binding protein